MAGFVPNRGKYGAWGEDAGASELRSGSVCARGEDALGRG